MTLPPNESVRSAENAGIASALAQANAEWAAGDRARAVATLTGFAHWMPAEPADLLLLHASRGRYDQAWRRYARRFAETAGLDPLAPPRPGGLQVQLETREQVDLVRAAMVHFRCGAGASARRDVTAAAEDR